MNSYLLADHIVQHALNALVTFLLFSLVAQGTLWLFNIRNFRLRALLCLFPLLRIALEPLFWLLPDPYLNLGFFSCSHPFQLFLYRSLADSTQAHLAAYNLKTAVGAALLTIPHFLLNLALVLFASISCVRFGVVVLQYLKSLRNMPVATQAQRPITNSRLRTELDKRGVEIYVSSEIEVPCAGWGRRIFLPEKLQFLVQEEFEAVIAHELAHLRWSEPLVRALCHALAALYWWVPMATWLSKIEEEQELAADSALQRYALGGVHLAAALQKALHQSHAPLGTAALSARGKTLLARVGWALKGWPAQHWGSAAACLGFLLSLLTFVGFILC